MGWVWAAHTSATIENQVQRLFSMFPRGRPGIALLILRAALAVMLIEGVSGRLLGLGSPWYLLAPGAVAVSLCLGFLTPVVAGLTIVLELATWATTGGPVSAVHVCAVLDAISMVPFRPRGLFLGCETLRATSNHLSLQTTMTLGISKR